MVFDKVFQHHWGPCAPATYGEAHQNYKTGADVDRQLELELQLELEKKTENMRMDKPQFFCNCNFSANARASTADIGTQCERIVSKSPTITSTARFFALSARHAALLDEINDLSEEIEYLNSKLRVVEEKKREVLAQCASYLGCSFKLRSDLELFISDNGRVALKNPEFTNEWIYLN